MSEYRSTRLFSPAAPRWVEAVLQWPTFGVMLRLCLASAYLIGGIDKAMDFPGAVAEQAHFGLQPAVLWAVLAIAVELIGALLLILNRWVWLAAGALGVLTLVAMLVANDFWHLSGQAPSVELASLGRRTAEMELELIDLIERAEGLT